MRSKVLINITMILAAGSARAVGGQDIDTRTPAEAAKHAFTPVAGLRAAAGAGVNQATDTPHEWGQGAQGFGKRIGSAFGKHLVKTAIQYPVSRFRHEAFGYQRSSEHGFKKRLFYALEGTVITHKTDTGKRTIATGELAGAFGSGFISRLWQPASTATVSNAFLSGGITLGVDAAGNVIKEFWPEIRHPHSHGKAVYTRAKAG
jgi:hypothetical protein